MHSIRQSHLHAFLIVLLNFSSYIGIIHLYERNALHPQFRIKYAIFTASSLHSSRQNGAMIPQHQACFPCMVMICQTHKKLCTCVCMYGTQYPPPKLIKTGMIRKQKVKFNVEKRFCGLFEIMIFKDLTAL